ncbi:MAG: metal-sulfur cluster assembly factor [Patescibacteria group bacterium]
MISKELVIEKLRTVLDPEVNLDIYTMGLIYDIKIESENQIKVLMTYTTPLCPYGPALKEKVELAMASLGFNDCQIEVTFEPPWKPGEELRLMLGV